MDMAKFMVFLVKLATADVEAYRRDARGFPGESGDVRFESAPAWNTTHVQKLARLFGVPVAKLGANDVSAAKVVYQQEVQRQLASDNAVLANFHGEAVGA